MVKNPGNILLSCVVICFCFSCAISSPLQTATDDGYEYYHTVMFLAYYGGTVIDEKGTKSITGHASISINREGVWGFYPDPPGRLASGRGQLKYSAHYPREQEYVEFTIDADILADIQALITEWENSPPFFAIPVNDCVSFIYYVAECIGLRYNSFALLPVSAVRSIRDNNDQTRVYRRTW